MIKEAVIDNENFEKANAIPQATMNIAGCPRCNQNHQDLKIYTLAPNREGWSWFAHCPSTSQPLFIKLTAS